MRERIYLSPPHLEGGEKELVLEALDSNWISPNGPMLERFEKELTNLHHRPAVCLSSGTAALHLALLMCEVQTEDEVLCSTFTFIASANPIVYLGAKPVFVDSAADTWNMSPELLERAILESIQRRQRAPAALVLTHLYGMCADMDRIVELCKQYEIALVEDAAEALGSAWRGKPLGTFGRFGVLSFNGNKIITSSGGGALLCREEEDVTRVRKLSTQAKDPVPWYEHSEVGYNYRMSNILAAIGLGQLQHLSSKVEKKRQIFDLYRKLLEPAGFLFPEELPELFANRWLSTLSLPKDCLQKPTELMAALEKENMEARPLWKSMHLQPVFQDCFAVKDGTSEGLFRRGLCLPSGTTLEKIDQKKICSLLLSLMKKS